MRRSSDTISMSFGQMGYRGAGWLAGAPRRVVCELACERLERVRQGLIGVDQHMVHGADVVSKDKLVRVP